MKTRTIYILFAFFVFNQISIFAQTDCNLGDDCELPSITLYPNSMSLDEFEFSILYEGCMEGATSETQTGLCGYDDIPTKWYTINVDAFADLLEFRITTAGSWLPQFSLFYGECGNLTPLSFGETTNPIICSSNSPVINRMAYKLPLNTSGETIRSYSLAVGAIGIIDNPNFQIDIASTTEQKYCVNTDDFTFYTCKSSQSFEVTKRSNANGVIDPDGDGIPGPFCPNEEITICFDHFYDASKISYDWFQCLIPNIGEAFVQEISYKDVQVSPNGATWYEEGITVNNEKLPRYCTYINEEGILKLCNSFCQTCPCEGNMDIGSAMPGGWFWLSPGGNGCENNGNPGSMYGLPGALMAQIHLCMDLQVKNLVNNSDCNTQKLDIAMQPFSDGTMGCWQDPEGECKNALQEYIEYDLDCNIPLPSTSTAYNTTILNNTIVNVSLTSNNPSYFIKVTHSENPNLQGATNHFFTQSGKIEDLLINATDTIQLIEYYFQTVDSSIICPSGIDTIHVKVLPTQLLDDEDFGTIELCQSELLTYQGPTSVNNEGTDFDPNGDGALGWQMPIAFVEGQNTVTISPSIGVSYSQTVFINVTPNPVVQITGDNPTTPNSNTFVSPVFGGTWASSDASIATITNSGVVTAVSTGKIFLTFTDQITSCSNTTEVLCIVNDTLPMLVKDAICVGSTTNILNYNFYIITVNDPSIANVDPNGMVIGLSTGSTKIIVSDANGVVSQLDITVFPKPNVEILGPIEIMLGGETSLSPTIGGTWASSNSAVATVTPAGIVKGVSEGNTTFIFTNANGCESLSTNPILVKDFDQYMLSGYAFIDLNENELFDSGEITLPNFKVIDSLTNNTYFTDNNGFYSFKTNTGSLTYKAEASYGTWKTSNYDFQINIIREQTTYNLPFQLKESDNSAIAMINSGLLRCNTYAKLNVSTLNTSNELLNGRMKIEFDSNTISYEFDPMPTKLAEDIYEFEFNDLSPGLIFSPEIKIGIPPFFPMQDSMTFSVILYDTLDNVLDSFYYTDVIRCSFDPNDKRSYPDRPGDANHILAGERIDYTIRFQNNGNDTAFYVKVLDVISPLLDPSSIVLQESSHDMKVQIHMDTVSFIFDPIALVDSTTNYIESQGFITFSIVAKEDLEEGELVINRASIFFDKNDPIHTNSTLNTVVAILPCYHISNEITQSGNTIQGANQALLYTWIDCEDGTIVAQSENSWFTPNFNGLYQIIIDGENCQNITDCYSFTIVDTKENDLTPFKIYPNPTTGIVTVDSEIVPETILVYDIKGVLLREITSQSSFDISILSTGVYIIRIVLQEENHVIKLVKQ